VAIIGKPNVGKSSLFNALAREDAAIVTDTPGTTRDALEVYVNIDGVPVILNDTAGIRETGNEIEALGVERSRGAAGKADVVIFMLDGSAPLSDGDREIARDLDPAKKTILAIGKADLPGAFDLAEVEALTGFPAAHVRLSPATGAGVRELESLVASFVLAGEGAARGLLVTKARHKDMLARAASEICEAEAILTRGEAPEFAEVGIREAYGTLGEMIGEEVTDDILDKVFEEFCIGK
jgi:tRNA modification GTPase